MCFRTSRMQPVIDNLRTIIVMNSCIRFAVPLTLFGINRDLQESTRIPTVPRIPNPWMCWRCLFVFGGGPTFSSKSVLLLCPKHIQEGLLRETPGRLARPCQEESRRATSLFALHFTMREAWDLPQAPSGAHLFLGYTCRFFCGLHI